MSQLMKGETWQDARKLVRGQPRFQYPVMVEAKADEIRCRVYKSGGGVLFESYAGKPLCNLDGFAVQFQLMMHHAHLTELDVGVLVNGNFNDSYRWVRSAKGFPQEKLDKGTGKVAPALTSEMVEFILFDLPESQKPFVDRLPDIDFAASGLRHYGLRCTRPSRILCHHEGDVWDAYNWYRSGGLEGAMAKTLDHVYARRRTFDWMKIKPKETFDGRITGFNEAISETGAPLGRVGSINVECADGSTASPAGIAHGLGRTLWEDQAKYIGQWIEFSAMERDRQGGYRHPIYDRFREDK